MHSSTLTERLIPDGQRVGSGLQMACRWAVLAALWVGMLPAGVSEAKVQVKVRPDGTRIIVNETKNQKAVRTSSKLRPIDSSQPLAGLIRQYARHQGLSPRLVQSVVQVESGYNPRALSSKGAQGLMQLMPGTARELGVGDAFDPEENIRGGTRYLRQQLDRFDGDLTLALAAYNAGPTAVSRYGGIPPYRETQRYVQKVLSLYRGTVPEDLRQRARVEAQQRQKAAAAKPTKKTEGNRIVLRRGENNRILFTNTPPKTD